MDIEVVKIAGQLGVGAFMGVVFGLTMYMIVRQMMTIHKEATDRLSESIERLRESFDAAKCKYPDSYVPQGRKVP